MFFKSNRAQTKIETVIGPGTELDGNIHTSESVRIDGKVHGEITADSVIIGEKGVVLGDVSANNVTIGGKIKGNISSNFTLDLLSKGQVLGDIRTNKLIIADGATFEGNCQMVKTDGQIIEMNPDVVNSDSPPTNGKNLKVLSGGKR